MLDLIEILSEPGAVSGNFFQSDKVRKQMKDLLVGVLKQDVTYRGMAKEFGLSNIFCEIDFLFS